MLESKLFEAQGEDFTVADIAHISPPPQTQPDAGLSRCAIIGNFPPRQCGLATFTRDMYACLHEALPKARWEVIAMTDPGGAYDYPPEVTRQIPQNEAAAYIDLADELNASGTQVLFVQHEFGIYGGPAGSYLIDCLERLNMPIVTTLHTILETPNDDQKRVMDALLRLSSTVVSMSRKGAQILKRVYNAPDAKVAIVPHGAPSRPLLPTRDFKARLGLEDKKTLTTFGLLSPNKGIETVIAAMPEILKASPHAMYLVIGATHPHLVRNEGEKYRDSLKAMARDLGVEKSVKFIDRFIDYEELVDILQATDIYVTPYLTETQITSGTLSYALALGRPTVSTPYWHAAEALANGVGILCPFHDTNAFAKAISGLLQSAPEREALSRRAYLSGLPSRWSAVARAYVTRAGEDVRKGKSMDVRHREVVTAKPAWTAIKRMSDDTGIYQHGKYRLPDRAHGYCTDDNCRALSLSAHLSRLIRLDETQTQLAYTYASFINHAWVEPSQEGDGGHAWTGGRFRNFMSFDRRWLDEGGSNDCCARTFESLVDVARSNLPADLRAWAAELGQRVFPHSLKWTSIRSQAILIKAFIRGFSVIAPPQEVQAAIRSLGGILHGHFRRESAPGQPWFEQTLSYDNARLAEALILAGHFLTDKEMLRDGVTALRWLMQEQTHEARGCFLPVPTSRFKEDGETHPLYDQQPLEVYASVEACLTAWRLTGDEEWRDEAMRAYAWFEGNNSQSLALIDADGGCYDGLTPSGCNENQGAESILAHHLSWTALNAGL
jgi:glycosyltransferase involved in cell wall biosynthesis